MPSPPDMPSETRPPDSELEKSRSDRLISDLVNQADCLLWQANVFRTDAPGAFERSIDSALNWEFFIPHSDLYVRIFGATAPNVKRAFMWSEESVPELAENTRLGTGAILRDLPNYELNFHYTSPLGRTFALREKASILRTSAESWSVVGVITDVTAQRETEDALAKERERLAVAYKTLKATQAELLETSRLAGIAEMASGVLHNIGNALNSVNVSVTIADERVRGLRIPGLSKTVQLLTEQGGHLAEFFDRDPRAKLVPSYLQQLAEHLAADRDHALREIAEVRSGIERINQIVAAQQSHARVANVVEIVPPAELVEFALMLNKAELTESGVTIVRVFAEVPPVSVPRHKVLQALSNLISNAKDALADLERTDKRITVTLRLAGTGRVQILVADNGVGIAPGNLGRIFEFGFTTKKTGCGFGLHTSALAAVEIGGSLVAHSDGDGLGATFTLELPTAQAEQRQP